MTTINILFIGMVDDFLVERLEAMGHIVQVMGANHDDIWERRLLEGPAGTGYFMSPQMRQLFDEAAICEDTCIIVRTSPSFADGALPELPREVRGELLLDFRRVLSADERQSFISLGCRHFTTNRLGESSLDWILKQKGVAT